MKRALHIAAAFWLCACSAMAGPEAQALFDRQDYAGAARIWQDEADAGSAEAHLALGMLADRGYGRPQDAAEAFRHYLVAAEAGLADAQFNVGVMLDAGIGQPRNTIEALAWYSRAGLRGHLRAQYNAALLLRAGDGVQQNADHAAWWLRRAESLPAARVAMAEIVTVPVEVPGRPEVIFERIGDGMAELVWTAPAGSASYALEILAAPAPGGDYDEPLVLTVTPGPALFQAMARPADGLVWRVSGIGPDGTRYAAGQWRQAEQGIEPPLARVRILAALGDPRVAGFARRLAADLRQSGFWVRLEARGGSGPATGTSVGYAYAEDQPLAGRIAAFLPVMGEQDTIRLPVGSALPGEIVIRLGGSDSTDQMAQAD